LFLICSNPRMADTPASWRMPTAKQMERLAYAAAAPLILPLVDKQGSEPSMPLRRPP
jgi:hypothetical protein